MRGMVERLTAMFVIATVSLAVPLQASVVVTIGQSWDGPGKSLQSIVDGLYGAGRIDVSNGYVGAKDGDLDPWFWVEGEFSALIVREVAGNANANQLGWYEETGSMPMLLNDGVHDGLLFDGAARAGTTAILAFAKPMTRFGLYLNPNGPLGATNAPEPEKFFSNRLFNDAGPDRSGALHSPTGGDMQALVFDLSNIKGANTWLVCFEDLDAGAMPGPACQSQTDNDYNDFIFEVKAYGATPVQPLSFGGLKAKYLR